MNPDFTDEIVEYRLHPGQRYGWWEDHSLESRKQDVGMVHGAVNDYRTKILLDTGATVSIVCLNLARKLGLKLQTHKQTKVSGMEGVPTYIAASAQVKITLGPRVVYILDVWVANIGKGIDVLLGVGFMYAAEIRVSVREGLITLPDETLVMCGWPLQQRPSVDLPIQSQDDLYLRTGEDSIVRIQYGEINPQCELVWAGRCDLWVTQIIYAARSWPIAVRVVNVSDSELRIDSKTPLARIVKYGFFTQAGRFVRPGFLAYREWQILIHENIPSPEAKMRARCRAETQGEAELPCTNTPRYKWPNKMLMRPKDGTNRVQRVKLQPAPSRRRVRFAQDAATQTDVDPEEVAVLSCDVGMDISDLNDVATEGITKTVCSDEKNPEYMASEVKVDDEILDPSLTGIDILEDNSEIDDFLDMPTIAMPGTPVSKLKKGYDRCMRVTAEELHLEPAVYMREGSEILSQLRDQLALLPDLQDLSPECNIEEADVGDAEKSTPEITDKLKRILKRHRKIFLGDGNAAPARGVVCDLDVADAKPVAQRPRSIAPHLMLKVYELLKMLLETGLIEHSESQWSSPIVIVLKKNGVDIRICIDYRVVSEFIKLLHYPLPLIDDLLIGFESAMRFMSLNMASGFWAVLMTERAKLISAFVCPFGHFQWIRMPFGLKNAPLIYQAVINNCLWGFVRLDPEEEARVYPDVLDFLGLDPMELG